MVHLTRVLICGVVVDLPVNRVVSQPIVHDAVVWDPDMVLVDTALAGTDTGPGIDPHRVKTLPFIHFWIGGTLAVWIRCV